MKRCLLVIAKEGFQDVELKGTRDALIEAGFAVELASTEAGDCTGKFGSTEFAQHAMCDIEVTQYDRIGFIGGPGAHALRDDRHAQRIAIEAVEDDIPLGAICIAPTILAAAGVLRGKHATVWSKDNDAPDFLASNGAIYELKPVVVDGKIVTADGPESAVEFGKTFAALTVA